MSNESKRIVTLKGEEYDYIFDLGQVLGNGAVSEVFIGQQTQNNQIKQNVAIKVIKDTTLQSKGSKQNIYLEREFEYCKLIKQCQDDQEKKNALNRNVLRIIDCLDYNANQSKISCSSSSNNITYKKNDLVSEKYIITELCNSKDLLNYMTQQAFYIQSIQVIEISLQIANGVKFLHDLNIMHRDLKPENIFVHKIEQDNQYIFKIGDFGIVNKIQQESIEQSFVGTINYMSPELINKQKYTYEIDYWSLGCIIYEIYKGHQKYQGFTEGQIIEKIRNSRYQLSDVSEKKSLDKIISKCLLLKNQGGYESIDQIISELQELLQQQLQNQMPIKEQQKQLKNEQFQQQQYYYQQLLQQPDQALSEVDELQLKEKQQQQKQINFQKYQQLQNKTHIREQQKQQINQQLQQLQQYQSQLQQKFQEKSQLKQETSNLNPQYIQKFNFSKSPNSKNNEQKKNDKTMIINFVEPKIQSSNQQEMFNKLSIIKYQNQATGQKFQNVKENQIIKVGPNMNIFLKPQENQSAQCNSQSSNICDQQSQQETHLNSNKSYPLCNNQQPDQNKQIQNQTQQKQYNNDIQDLCKKNSNERDLNSKQFQQVRTGNHLQNNQELINFQPIQKVMYKQKEQYRGSSCAPVKEENANPSNQVQMIKARSISQNKQYQKQSNLNYYKK